jgi:hypothetical protein
MIALRDSSTYDVCKQFASRTREWVQSFHQGSLPVSVYGDATGDSRKSAASRTDWQIVRDFFAGNAREYEATFRVPSRNPEVKDRINCVNAIILNASKQRRLAVSPRCKQLIRDLQQVSWKTDANGNSIGDLDRSDRIRTHLSDALGYLIAWDFPMRAKIGYTQRGTVAVDDAGRCRNERFRFGIAAPGGSDRPEYEFRQHAGSGAVL